jgi:RNA polymerase subunit RPABC4/transcription elongation factor Spt4
MNGFAGASSSRNGMYAFLAYMVLIAACLGIILLILILTGKEFELVWDWAVTLGSIGSGLIFWATMISSINRLSGSLGRFGVRISVKLQSGGIMIVIGWIISFVFMIAAWISDDTNYSSNRSAVFPERACGRCGKVIPGGYSSCPNCGYGLPVESTMPTDLSKIGKVATAIEETPNYYLEDDNNKWICGGCGSINKIKDEKCGKCGKDKGSPV